jgi:hypothetical protein
MGEQERPGVVAGFQILQPGFANQVVFPTPVEKRLVGNLVENGHAGAAEPGQRGSQAEVIGSGAVIVLADVLNHV